MQNQEQQKKVRKKRLKGIAGVISKQMEPLNDSLLFKELFGDFKGTYLLNAVDSKHAALVIFNEGKIEVKGISNTDKKALKKKVLGWDSKLATTTPIFLQVAMGELSIGAMAKKVVTRKMKVKGLKKLLKLQEIFALL